MTVKEYANQEGLSLATARRKLEALVAEGSVRRVRGTLVRGLGTFKSTTPTVDYVFKEVV